MSYQHRRAWLTLAATEKLRKHRDPAATAGFAFLPFDIDTCGCLDKDAYLHVRPATYHYTQILHSFLQTLLLSETYRLLSY